jgi:hypothetical protein
VLYTLCREYTYKCLQDKDIDADKLRTQPPELQSHFMMKAQNAKKKRIERREVRREERKNKRIVKVEGKDDGDD